MLCRRQSLERVVGNCLDFARNLPYHRALKNYIDNKTLHFWIYISNNSIDLAVLKWFHMFGYHNDDLHWKQVVSDKDAFRQQLYSYVNMNEDEWKTHRNELKDYREKDVAHIEVRLRSEIPEMGIALRAAAHYYEYSRNELHDVYDPPSPYRLDEYCESSLKQAERVVESAYSATKHIKERVG